MAQPSHWFLNHSERANHSERECPNEVISVPFLQEIVHTKQYCFPGRTAEITGTINDLKDIGVVVP